MRSIPSVNVIPPTVARPPPTGGLRPPTGTIPKGYDLYKIKFFYAEIKNFLIVLEK